MLVGTLRGLPFPWREPLGKIPYGMRTQIKICVDHASRQKSFINYAGRGLPFLASENSRQDSLRNAPKICMQILFDP